MRGDLRLGCLDVAQRRAGAQLDIFPGNEALGAALQVIADTLQLALSGAAIR
jgi:hypothetical protein